MTIAEYVKSEKRVKLSLDLYVNSRKTKKEKADFITLKTFEDLEEAKKYEKDINEFINILQSANITEKRSD